MVKLIHAEEALNSRTKLRMMSAQSQRYKLAETMVIKIREAIENYLGTRSFLQSHADEQSLADKAYKLQQTRLVCDSINKAVAEVQKIIDGTKESGGNTQVVYQYAPDSTGNADNQTKSTSSTVGKEVDKLQAGQTGLTSGMSLLTEGFVTYREYQYNSAKKKLDDTKRAEATVADVNMLIASVDTLIAGLEQITNGSQQRIREAKEFYDQFRIKVTNEILTEVKAHPEEYFIQFGKEYNDAHKDEDEITSIAIKEDPEIRAKFIDWFNQDVLLQPAADALKEVVANEGKLVETVKAKLGKTNIVEFREAIAGDKKYVDQLVGSDYSTLAAYMRLAGEAGIDQYSIAMFVHEIKNNKKIDASEKNDVLKALVSGLTTCKKEAGKRSMNNVIKSIYLLAKLDKRLADKGINTDLITATAKSMGLPNQVCELFSSYYPEGAKVYTVGTKEKPIKPMKDTLAKKSKSVLIKVYNRAREIQAEINKKTRDPSPEQMRYKAITLTMYAYHKLCNHFGIDKVNRGRLSPQTEALKNMAVEIAAAMMDQSYNTDVDIEVNRLFSTLRDLKGEALKKSFLEPSIKPDGWKLERNAFKHRVKSHFSEHGPVLLKPVDDARIEMIFGYHDEEPKDKISVSKALPVFGNPSIDEGLSSINREGSILDDDPNMLDFELEKHDPSMLDSKPKKHDSDMLDLGRVQQDIRFHGNEEDDDEIAHSNPVDDKTLMGILEVFENPKDVIRVSHSHSSLFGHVDHPEKRGKLTMLNQVKIADHDDIDPSINDDFDEVVGSSSRVSFK